MKTRGAQKNVMIKQMKHVIRCFKLRERERGRGERGEGTPYLNISKKHILKSSHYSTVLMETIEATNKKLENFKKKKRKFQKNNDTFQQIKRRNN